MTKDGPKVYRDLHLTQIAMPLGGLGAGCVCLNGHGGLQDFSLRHRPATTAVPDGHGVTDAVFALLHIKGDVPVTRLVEGPLPAAKVYDQGLQAQGYRKGGHEGLPRFAECEFAAEYPFGEARLRDPKVPVAVRVTGWSPFIPGDDVNSGLPAAILEYTVENTSGEFVACEFSFHASHLACGASGWAGARNAVLPEGGILFSNIEDPAHESFGTAAVLALRHAPRLKADWFRGGWFDALSLLWREVSTGSFQENTRPAATGRNSRNGGSLLVPLELAPGESATVPLVLAWHFPNPDLSVGATAPGTWRPFYAGHWKDAGEVARYVRTHYDDLRARTVAFQKALYSSTLPPAALDAVGSNLAILKSPTVLRQENGSVWGWEGCFVGSGCCHGTCTHVWNYAQALPHLFPKLERTLREQELERSQDERGHINFRAALPDGPVPHDYHPAADGQLGGLLKLYRDWQIGGDTDWLRRLYPQARRSLDFCIATWDPDGRGGLFEPHHNTYDIEFWGPDGMCGSIYIGALAAMAQMAGALGEDDGEARYAALAEQAARFLDAELFNGDYYEQRVQWEDLRDQSFRRSLEGGLLDRETLRLARAEGPKYQYGAGCLSDGIIGAWMAALYGVPTPLDPDHVRTALRSIVRHNFRPDLSEHACTQRPGYAVGREPGLLLCTWPHGGKPGLPFVYSDEVWTGIEYQVASHLILEGLVTEGLTLVEAARSRYDGHVRNPFNEYECGSYYARAMASYALLPALSGFRYSAVDAALHLAPRVSPDDFRTFFAAESGFGTISLTGNRVVISMVEGTLQVATLHLTRDGVSQEIAWGVMAGPGEPVSVTVTTPAPPAGS